MRSEELRIGNLVTAIRCDETEIIDKISKLVCIDGMELKETSKGWVKVKPIPLTEDWLLKFGVNNLNSIDTNGGSIFVDLKDKSLGIEGFGISSEERIYYVKCEYLHQLQNLYFALTGEELKIKK